MGAFANLSATWFPAHQRTTSTTILSVVKGLGFRLSFIVGPLIVPSTGNSTQLYHRTVDEVRKDIMFLMYVTFGWCALLFICILVYFPAKPPHPPSRAASLKKLSHIAGIKLLVRNRKFWIVAFAFILPYGTQIGWASVLDVNLSKISISQTTAGWLGFTAGTIGNVCSLLVGKCSDIFSRRMKLIILLCYAVSVPFFTMFTLLYTQMIPFFEVLLWLSLIFGVSGVLAPTPLFYELSCEVAWPVPEEINNGFLTMILNFPIAVFLSILMIPGIGTTWMNWFVIGSLLVSIPVVVFFKEQYSRLDQDVHQPNDRNVRTSDSTENWILFGDNFAKICYHKCFISKIMNDINCQ